MISGYEQHKTNNSTVFTAATGPAAEINLRIVLALGSRVRIGPGISIHSRLELMKAMRMRVSLDVASLPCYDMRVRRWSPQNFFSLLPRDPNLRTNSFLYSARPALNYFSVCDIF